MVMGSLFDTPTDEEDQNPPQPQPPPPQDPMAQQPAPSYADMAQGASNIANTFAPPQPPTTGQDFIDAPTGSPRAQLEQERQGQSQYSSAGQALATALPMVAFGAPAAAAGLGIQAATQAAGLPQPVQDVASLLSFTEGGLVQRGLQAGLGGLGAYGGQQADQALNLPQIPGLGGPLALAGGIGGMGAAGALERGVGGLARNADPLAGVQSPQSPESANFQGPTAEPLYRGNQTGQPGNWWSVSPDYAQTYGGPAQAATLGTHPLETLDVTTPEGKAALLDSMNRVRPDLAAANTGYIARLGDPNFQSGMSFQPQDWPGVEQDLQNQGYRAMKLGPDWSGTVRPGENQDVYYTLDRGAVTPTTTTAPTSTTTTSGQPNEPEFRSDFNIQSEQLSALAKSIADHQKVISDMAVNAGITEDQARQMLANADMSSIRTRGASAREDYEETIGNLMRQDGLTREQAERVYMRPASFENGTNAPTSTTTTSGGNYWDTTGIGPKIEAEQQRGPYIQWINENIHPDEQRVYKAALADVLAGKQAQAPTPEGTLGPDPATNPYRIAHDSIRQNLAPDMPYLPAPPPGSGATETPFRAYPGAPREAAPAGEPPTSAINPAPRFWENTTQFPDYKTGQSPFRSPKDGLIAEGHDGNIHNVTGFLGVRDGQQWFQTEDGQVPLSLLKNLSAADRAELGQMRTAAGGMPPNTPNAQPITGQPGSPGAQGFQQSPAGQQFAGQGAAGMNVTQPGVSSSNAAPSTTYGGGAGGITGQAPPAGREPPSRGVGGDRGGPPISKNFGVLDYLNIPRTLMAGGDASMSLRQSIVMAFAHPQRWLQSLDAGAQAFTSDIAAKDFADQVAADPLRDTVLKNVYQAPTGRGEGTLTTREEQYASPATIPLVSKIPVVGGPISEYYRATERGTLTQLNQVRWDVSKDFAQKLMNSRGETPETVSPYTQRMVDKYVSAINEATGRGTLGSAAVEKAVLPLSQVFFSWRNAVAKPEYVAQIFSEPFTPAWNAIVKDQAAFLVGGATTLGLLNLAAKQAGVPIQIGLDPRSADFGKAVIGNAHIDIWGGFQQPARAAWQAVMAAEGKPNAVTQGGREYQKNLGDIGITYLGNKLSPQAALAGQIALMKYGDRLSPGTLDALHEAFPTNRQPSLDLRTASQFLTPLWIQDMASAIKNDGVGPGIAAGAASFMGVGVQDYKPSASAQVANAGTQALSEPATLAKAFPDAPIMQQILKGQNYNDLLPTEKTAIKSVLDPAIVQQLDQQNRQQNPVLARHGDAVDYLTQKKNAAENELLDRYNAGTMDGAHVTNLMKAVQADYYNTKAKVDADPAYKAEIAKIPAASTNAQSALDGYYQVEGKAGRAQYIQWLADRDPALAARIATAVQPKNQSKLELMYANGELR